MKEGATLYLNVPIEGKKILEYQGERNIITNYDSITWKEGIEEEYDGIYDMKQGHHIITYTGRIMWLNTSTTPDSLRKMNLIGKYEIIRQLNENRFITDLIAKVKKTIPPFYGQRMEGSIMKIYWDNYIYEYQCHATNNTEIIIIYDRRTVNTKQPFLPVIWNEDIDKPFITIQINEENYKRYQGHVLLNFKNKTIQQQKEITKQLYSMNNFRLSVKSRKTLTYQEAEIAKYYIYVENVPVTLSRRNYLEN